MADYFENPNDLKFDIQAWVEEESNAEAYELQVSLVGMIDNYTYTKELETFFPTLSGTIYIELMWEMLQEYKTGLTLQGAYDNAYTTVYG